MVRYSRTSKIARAGTSRYAEAPTYRELLLAAAKAEEAFLAEQKAKAEQAAEPPRCGKKPLAL